MGDLSKNFSRSEFACKCGCGFDTVDAALLEVLEKIRCYFDGMVKVTSGCRCRSWNQEVGGGTHSQHLLGRAADIQVEGVNPRKVAEYAHVIGVPGVGTYDSFTHVDTRSSGIAVW